MDTFIAVVFDNDDQAYQGADALRDLHQSGDVLVYSAAVIGKDADGKVEIKKAADEGPVGTALGMMVGAMAGVLAGPIAVAGGAVAAGSAAAGVAATGMAAGGMTGSLFGMYKDLFEAGLSADVLDKVSTELEPGKSAVVASIDEIWTTPLDVKMEDLGGKVFRQARIDIIDEQVEREIQATDAEMKALQEEWDAADEETRKRVKAKIEAAKSKMKELNKKALDRLVKANDEFEERQAAMDKQVLNSVEGTQAKLEKRKAELKQEYSERSSKLKKAAELAGDALS